VFQTIIKLYSAIPVRDAPIYIDFNRLGRVYIDFNRLGRVFSVNYLNLNIFGLIAKTNSPEAKLAQK
jgi:hypothetical protein